MDLVMGLYDNFTKLTTEKGGLMYSIKSLRTVNPTCMVVVYCRREVVFEDLRNFCMAYSVILIEDFNYPENINCPGERKMIEHRFFLYRDYIMKCKVPIRRILLTDLDDVIFQGDPFAIPFKEKLYCATEKNNLADMSNRSSCINMNWINEYLFIPMNYSKFTGNPITCCGTILGTREGILKFLDFYVKAQEFQKGTEQGLWNIFVYNYSISHAIPLIGDSRILTLDSIDFSEIPMNAEGKAVNVHGEIYMIIHQYNRCNPEFWKSKVT